MILRVYMQLGGKDGMSIRHSIQDLQGNELAQGDNQDSGALVTLRYGGKTVRFERKPVKIEKSSFSFPLPIPSKSKKTLGHQAVSQGQPLIRMYTEPVTCGKMWIFKRNIGITVYQYAGKTFHCSQVGFPKETSHYYCLRSAQWETVMVLERHSFTDDTYRATIYLKDPGMLELAMLVCANEIMEVYFSPGDAELRDVSAGHYISLTDAEKSLYDKDFIPAVKAMSRIYD